jgi:hypothetical protein
MKVISHKTFLQKYKCLFEKLEIKFICLFLVNFLLLYPESGSAFAMRIRIQPTKSNADSDPKHWFLLNFNIHIYSNKKSAPLFVPALNVA